MSSERKGQGIWTAFHSWFIRAGRSSNLHFLSLLATTWFTSSAIKNTSPTNESPIMAHLLSMNTFAHYAIVYLISLLHSLKTPQIYSIELMLPSSKTVLATTFRSRKKSNSYNSSNNSNDNSRIIKLFKMKLIYVEMWSNKVINSNY